MLRLIEKEIPKRLQPKVVFANFITLNRNERFILLLTNDLKVFEIRSHEILNVISLKDTILKGISLSITTITTSSSSSSIQNQQQEHATDGNSPSQVQDSDKLRLESNSQSITFGKYFQNLENQQKLFILLKVYTKLLVLERKSSGYEIKYQYENVENFEIVDSKNNFQPLVGIHFTEEPFYMETNFTESEINIQEKDSITLDNLKNTESIKHLLEKIKNAKTELAIHRIRTKNEFVELKNRLRFGLNLIRNENLGEKQMLGKYGDVWMRVANEQLIIGIPIMNNCSEKLKCLTDIRLAIICEEKNEIHFEYNLYELKNDLYEFKIDSEFFDNDEKFNKNIKFNEEWLPIQTRSLYPETSGVIILTTKLENLILTTSDDIQCLCFIIYDVIYKRKKLTQQHFLKKIHINTDILFNKDYQIEMDLNKNDYMDLLAIIATSCFANFLVTCTDDEHRNNFDDLFTELKSFISMKLEFKYLKKTENEFNSTNDTGGGMMNVDGGEQQHELDSMSILDNDNSNKDFYELFYNDNKVINYWYGSLIRLKVKDKNTINFKIYTRSEDKIYAFVKALYNNLTYKFEVIPMNYTEKYSTKNLKYFENCLKNELNFLKNFCKENEKNKMKYNEVIEFQKRLCAKELETDMAAKI